MLGLYPVEPATERYYAGFWLRACAYAIDAVIVSIYVSVLVATLAFVTAALSDSLQSLGAVPASIASTMGALLIAFAFCFAPAIYFACFESSKFQGTPGKMLLGLQVVDLNGQRLTFWRSMGRQICKLASIVSLYIGFAMAGFTPQKQALHDMMTGSLVIKKQPQRERVMIPMQR